MPRHVGQPQLPDTPGAWLAAYRYRLETDGHPTSPEVLAAKLGVSGDTLRRWESGRLRPSRLDLHHFGEICRLEPVEQAFLLDAFSETHFDESPDPLRFCIQAQNILAACQFPAFLHDSLFYVRACNSYVEMIAGLKYPPAGESMIRLIHNRGLTPETNLAIRAERKARLLREFWFCTANLCGTTAYIKTIAQLAEDPDFRQGWMNLALQAPPRLEYPIGSPYYFTANDGGRFRVFVSTVAMPPNYYLSEYVPIDTEAWRRMAEKDHDHSASVSIARRTHWAEDFNRSLAHFNPQSVGE